MRANYTQVFLAIVAFCLFSSCSKKSQEDLVLTSSVTDEVISATVSSGRSYELPLAKYGTVTIHKQAQHYLESVAGVDAKSGIVRYKYVPESTFNGEDQVTLKSSQTIRGSSGTGCNRGGSSYEYDRVVSTYVTIKFNVVD